MKAFRNFNLVLNLVKSKKIISIEIQRSTELVVREYS